ncbi:23S rRNA G2445 N2-methylase RlmL [Saccharothrix tamanrassetensis]|uniref:23S rRNA G2445 N2-methylase RlmL n=1 Tax=Saccharothrix tamanrassetensis TaxID=1051531 RepID=A0A841CWK6_9PSEU|nr:methyltransferase domain-containing protein [Saccharothrix tamanrassetensis]MBB5960387.1 23S rRNA G2445 N2-methylase RlmL [Saccharothrix tamanrassetensis]
MAAQEIARLGTVRRTAHREVWWTCPTPGPEVLGLRCVDDVFVVAATVTGIGHTRGDLRLLAKAAAAVDAERVVAQRMSFGIRACPSTVDVSASFLGRRNYTRFDLEDTVGEPLAAALGLPYRSRRNGHSPPPDSLSWRVTVTDDQAVLSLRIAPKPLHRRSYRQASRPGALHPPVAAAMLLLASPRPGERLLDPFCGTGTIPVEADPALTGIGTDADPSAIAAARTNGAGRDITWALADAGRLPFRTGGIDVVVTNPPWNRQVKPSATLAADPDRFWAELTRTLTPTGRAVLLLPDADHHLADAVKAGLTPTDRRPVSLFGTHPELVTVKPRTNPPH